MTIAEMHHDFKVKMNKTDSNGNKNYLVPEIDWALNQGMELFVKLVAVPRYSKILGFEKNQRSIDDIKNIVEENKSVAVINNVATLPGDYWHHIKSRVEMNNDNCKQKIGRVLLPQHDDTFEESPFTRSSFGWKEVNGVFNSKGLELYTDGTFTFGNLYLTYIKKLKYIHNAFAFNPLTGYNRPSGVTLVGTEDCELSEHTHSEIVDLSVLLATGQIESPGYQFKQNKINLNKLNE